MARRFTNVGHLSVLQQATPSDERRSKLTQVLNLKDMRTAAKGAPRGNARAMAREALQVFRSNLPPELQNIIADRASDMTEREMLHAFLENGYYKAGSEKKKTVLLTGTLGFMNPAPDADARYRNLRMFLRDAPEDTISCSTASRVFHNKVFRDVFLKHVPKLFTGFGKSALPMVGKVEMLGDDNVRVYWNGWEFESKDSGNGDYRTNRVVSIMKFLGAIRQDMSKHAKTEKELHLLVGNGLGYGYGTPVYDRPAEYDLPQNGRKIVKSSERHPYRTRNVSYLDDENVNAVPGVTRRLTRLRNNRMNLAYEKHGNGFPASSRLVHQSIDYNNSSNSNNSNNSNASNDESELGDNSETALSTRRYLSLGQRRER